MTVCILSLNILALSCKRGKQQGHLTLAIILFSNFTTCYPGKRAVLLDNSSLSLLVRNTDKKGFKVAF